MTKTFLRMKSSVCAGGGDGRMGFDHIPLHLTGLSYDINGTSDQCRKNRLFINDAGRPNYPYSKK